MERGPVVRSTVAAVIAIAVAIAAPGPAQAEELADGSIVWEHGEQVVEHESPPMGACLSSHWWPEPAETVTNETDQAVAVYSSGQCKGEPAAIVESDGEYTGRVTSLKTMPTQS